MDLSTTKSLYTYTPFFGRLTLNNYTSLKLNQTSRTVSSVYNLKICRKSALLNMNKVMLFNPWCFGFLTLLKKILFIPKSQIKQGCHWVCHHYIYNIIYDNIIISSYICDRLKSLLLYYEYVINLL